MEYLVVRYDDDRSVIIDGSSQGRTNQLIELQQGTYHITLNPPDDFEPEYREIVLRRTSVNQPREVIFEKI